MQYIYLHGFASSPNSAKARYVSDRFKEYHTPINIADLNQGDFSHLTISRQVQQIAGILNIPTTIIGSSLGGLTAAHLGQQYNQVERLILLAPAFGFLSHWLPRLGANTIKNWQEK
ncbi:MAG: alpha/beta hydrolase, partial [Richelia sp.]|nr:alpha/beta hydrolase [Richelia sp.]